MFCLVIKMSVPHIKVIFNFQPWFKIPGFSYYRLKEAGVMVQVTGCLSPVGETWIEFPCLSFAGIWGVSKKMVTACGFSLC